jgi:amino acid adenylation domain-containing protein
MVPAVFVRLDALPLGPSGKRDRRALPPPPAPAAPETAERPLTPTEERLAAVWRELLTVDAVAPATDFFLIGGHSVLVIRMLARIKSAFQVQLSVRSIFEERTLARVAAAIDAAPRVASDAIALVGGQGQGEVKSYLAFDVLPIARLEGQSSFALSPYQLPEWYFHELAPDSPMYNIFDGMFFYGDLDVEAFRAALETMMARHAIFRTTFGFDQEGQRPVQHIKAERKLTLDELYLDCRHVPESEWYDHAMDIAAEFGGKTLDFENGPIFEVRLAQYTGGKFLFVYLTNHIVWDELSGMTLGRELCELYNAHHLGREPRLAPRDLEYGDYAEWINRAVSTGLFDSQRQYWLRQFRELPPALDLPTDFPRPAHQTFNGNEVAGRLPAATYAKLAAFLEKNPSITLSVLMSAVFNLQLYRLSGQDDIVVGVPTANRGHERIEPIVGPFATALPIRTRMNESMTFRDLVTESRRTYIEALDNYAYPSVLAIQEINPPKDHSRGRLFSVMMGVQNNKTSFWSEFTSFHELGMTSFPHRRQVGPYNSTSRCDLRLLIDQLADDVFFVLAYNTDLFLPATMQRWMHQLLALIEQVVADPDLPLASYRLLAEADTRRVLDGFNATTEALDVNGTLASRIARVAAEHPSRVAVEVGDRKWTYAQLDAEANALAHGLVAAGVAREERVGVLLEPSFDMVATLVAILKAGAAYVPISPEQPPARQAAILSAAGAGLLLSAPGLVSGDLDFTGRVAFVGAQSPLRTNDTSVVDRAVSERSLACVFFTSGSTGVPKGIDVEQRGIHNLLASTQGAHPLGAEDATLFITPYNFDVSLLDIFWPLTTGARLVCPGPGDAKSPIRIGKLIEQHAVTILQCVPIMADALVDARASGDIGPLSSLRVVMCAGAVMSRALRDRFHATFACRLANHYGPTEATVDVSRFDTRREFTGDVVPIGRPVSNTRLYVLDARFQPVAVGVVGELYISSVQLARGYSSDSARTAQAFLPDPFSPTPGARMYRTGDLAKYDEDGTFSFVGRVDRQVKVRGNRVEIEEIETHLSAHPAIASCAVLPRKDASGVGALVAYVELRARAQSVETSNGESLRIVTLAQRPDLKRAMDALHVDAWPAYFEGDAIQARLWPRLAAELPEYQIALVTESDEVLAVGNTAPIGWDGTGESIPAGWDGGLERAFDGMDASRPKDTLLIFAGVVGKTAAGRGLSTALLHAFKAVARGYGLSRVLAPVRPTGKAAHPEVTFEAWCARRRADGQFEDDWLRVHERLGARLLKIDLASQRVVGTLAQWEAWTGVRFDREGLHDVANALQPVCVDLEAQVAEYRDPSAWMEHPLDVPARATFEAVDTTVLKDHLRASVPEYMVPEHVRYLTRMPLTTTGKIDAKALPEIEVRAREYVAPTTSLQGELCAIWAQVLRVDRVGVADDFFDLGGHSLRAVQMLAKVEERTGVRLGVAQLLRQSTVRDLERLLAAAGRRSGAEVAAS